MTHSDAGWGQPFRWDPSAWPVRSAARAAEKHCLVSQALDVPVHLGIHVYSPVLSQLD